MPVTRTNSRQLSKPQPTPPTVEHEVIVLSSDSEGPPPQKTIKKSVKHRTKHRAKSRPLSAEEVIELTDTTEGAPSPYPRKTSSASRWEAKHKKLEDENRILKEEIRRLNTVRVTPKPAKSSDSDLERLRKENEQLTQSKKKFLGTLEEYVTCEICTLKMWSSYTLMCGHTFCLDCLQDWFSTALAQHMTNNPEWSPNPPAMAHYDHLLQQPNLNPQTRHALVQQLERMQAAIPQPNYTCPSCRDTVKKSPIEAFAVKNIVRAIAEAEGETSPRRNRNRAGRVRRDDPWEGFFPKSRT